MSTGADPFRPIEPAGAAHGGPRETPLSALRIEPAGALHARRQARLPLPPHRYLGRKRGHDDAGAATRRRETHRLSDASRRPRRHRRAPVSGQLCHEHLRHAAKARQARRADPAARRAIGTPRRRRTHVPARAAPTKPRCSSWQTAAPWSARYIDLSLSGASVVTPARPPLGAEVMLDKRRATVVRHHERGIGVEFVKRSVDAAFSAP